MYRYLIDDFVIEFGHRLKPKDFIIKREDFSKNRKGKRQYLNVEDTRIFTKGLDSLFRREVDVPRIMHGERQEFETLICEEALLFAKYLRNERQDWIPRVGNYCLNR